MNDSGAQDGFEAGIQPGLQSRPDTDHEHSGLLRSALESVIAEVQAGTRGGIHRIPAAQRVTPNQTEDDILLDEAAAVVRMLQQKRRRAEGRIPKRSKGVNKTIR